MIARIFLGPTSATTKTLISDIILIEKQMTTPITLTSPPQPPLPDSYTWGTPDTDTYFNWGLIIWRLGGVLFMLCCLPIPLLLMVLVHPFVGFIFGMGIPWILFCGFDPLSIFEGGRAREEARMMKEKPFHYGSRGTFYVGGAPSKAMLERTHIAQEWQMVQYNAKRKAWRKERRSRWLHGNFRQFPMGDLELQPFPGTVEEQGMDELDRKFFLMKLKHSG